MTASILRVPIRLAAVVLVAALPACHAVTSVAPVELSTELSFTTVLARAPMRDSAAVRASPGGVAVAGLLNQTAPCFGIASSATQEGDRVVLRLTATETRQTCATFAAGAFDYGVVAKGLAPGVYDVDVVHRVAFKDGRIVEEKVGSRRIQVP